MASARLVVQGSAVRLLLLLTLTLLFNQVVAIKSATAATGWELTLDNSTGLPRITRGGIAALSTSQIYWGTRWAWAATSHEMTREAPSQYKVRSRSAALSADIITKARLVAPDRIVWTIDLLADREKSDIIGGGWVFQFDLANFGSELGEPVISSTHAGWRWGRTGGAEVEFQIEPAPPAIRFEPGRKSEIRVFLAQEAVTTRPMRYTVTVRVGGPISIAPPEAERFGPLNPEKWPLDTVDWQSSPIDLSFLNASERPAGKRGFVKAVGDRLKFADGTPARFWGTNLNANALFGTTKQNVVLQARRLSALGYNLVRIHHHDSPWVNPNVFGTRKDIAPTSLDEQALDSIDWWVKCLKDEGIYVWLDLHVGRKLTAHDQVAQFDEIRKGAATADLRGFSHINPTIRAAMKRFNVAYLDRTNRHTGIRYKDEPALAALLVTNENDVTHHFGNWLLPDKNVPEHNRLYMAAAKDFARINGLPDDQIWKSWQHGPSKIFLNDLEQRFSADMIGHLRGLGFKIPIVVTSSWGSNPVSSLPALTLGDVIDVHAYSGAGTLEIDPYYAPNLVHSMVAARVAGKPLTVSEWGTEPFPLHDRHTVPMYVAAAAAHQGWDALMHFAYSQQPLNNAGGASNWHSFNDPSLYRTLSAAALAFRRADVQEGQSLTVWNPGAVLFDQPLSVHSARALRQSAEREKVQVRLPLTKALPWLTTVSPPTGSTVVVRQDQPVGPPEARGAMNDTKELRRDWADGVFTINSSRTQAAMGWIGGRQIILDTLMINTSTPSAAVAVQSLDGHSIKSSNDLLITLAARSVPNSGNSAPFRVETLSGRMVVKARPGLKLSRQHGRGWIPVPLAYRDGGYEIVLDDLSSSGWLRLH